MAGGKRTRKSTAGEAVAALGGVSAAAPAELAVRAARAIQGEPLAHLSPVEAARRKGELMKAQGVGLEALVERSRAIVDAGLAFSEIGPEDEGPPADWVQRLGAKAAMERFRLARSCWLPKGELPSGISVATEMLRLDARVKAAQTEGPRTLNVAIQMVMNPAKYEELELEDDR